MEIPIETSGDHVPPPPIGQVVDQGLGEGKTNNYTMQYYPARGKTLKTTKNVKNILKLLFWSLF